MAPTRPMALTAEDYRRLQPFLYGALAHLTRQGFAVQPADAQDLVHDFYVDEWEAIQKHFDPARGPLENYVFVAFVRYARPRIVRLQAWQGRLQDIEALVAAHPDPPAEAADTAAVQEVVRALPHDDRALLLDYLARGPRSERQLGRERGLSRYQVRERLVDVLGRLVVAAQAHPLLSADDWRVAHALWHEGRTPRAAAAYLGRTTEQVQQSRRRIFSTVADALKALHKRSSL